MWSVALSKTPLVFATLLAFLSIEEDALAQASATVTIQNDDRFRGRSISDGEPVVIGSVSYDHLSGVYIGGSAVLTTNGDGVGLLRASGHAGYAAFVGPNISVDGGILVNAYSDRYSGETSQTFTEIFGGVSAGDFAFRASYSPSYLDQGLQTLYLEVNAVRDLGLGFRANASAGYLTRLAGEGSLGGANSRYDFQLGLTKELDRLAIFAVASNAGSGRGSYFDGPWQGRNAIVLGISRSF